MNEQLKPCPFCGCEMNFDRVLSGWNKITGMHGDNCPLDGNDFITWSSTADAPIIQKFNTRADGWISVDDAMPTEGASVLTIGTLDSGERSDAVVAVYVRERFVSGYCFNGDRLIHMAVETFPTHWMALPPTPEAK